MMNLEGRTLHDALSILREMGIEPEIIRTAGFREAADGTERVIRIQEDGRRLTVARFPDMVKMPEEKNEA
jgi:hypothetical protein